MDLGQLRYFNKIVEHRSFTRAAKACFVSQPALSQQIAKLEKELGQPLFQRQGRQVTLTRAGQILSQRANSILDLVDDAKRQIMDDGEHGQIGLSAIPTIAPFLLPRVLSEVAPMFPAATIQIHEDATENLVKRCLEGDVDIGILSLPINVKNLTTEPLFSEELLLAMPSNHPLATSSRITVKDICHETFVLLGSSHCLVEVIESFCRERNFQPVAQSRIEQLDTVKNLVARGHGLSFIPQMAAESGNGESIVYRSLAGDKPTRKIAVCYNSERFQSQLITNFLKALRECLDNGTVDWYPKPPRGPKGLEKLPNSVSHATQ